MSEKSLSNVLYIVSRSFAFKFGDNFVGLCCRHIMGKVVRSIFLTKRNGKSDADITFKKKHVRI